MAIRRTNTGKKRTTRFVKGGPATPTGKAAPKKVIRKTTVKASATVRGASTRSAKSSPRKTATPRSAASTPTKSVKDTGFGPSWTALEKDNAKKMRKKAEKPSFVASLSTIKFVLGVLAVAIVFTLYVGHVYATQELMQQVQRLSRERLELDLDYNRVRGQFDRVTGHDDIYERARALGFREAVPVGNRLEVR